MAKILISACLVGQKVRYNGKDLLQETEGFQTLKQQHELIPLCPEVAGGLSTPRPPAEIQMGDSAAVFKASGKVIATTGEDVTSEFVSGAEQALALCKEHDIHFAVLTESSPSCGRNKVYDGSFSGNKVEGIGLTAYLLEKNGIRVFSQFEIEKLLKSL
jgi:uncharacterized protein YbbK (DUF523 family)